MGCDNMRLAEVVAEAQLSVSSNGSNGLRHPLLFLTEDDGAAFSILERIEWAATSYNEITGEVSYPFQYPRTDRMGCDWAAVVAPGAIQTTFSILERIEWAATCLRRRLRHRTVTFSILERIEWAATQGG